MPAERITTEPGQFQSVEQKRKESEQQLRDLYKKSRAWLLQKPEHKLIAEFDEPQEIPYWQFGDFIQDGKDNYGMSLQKGIIVEKSGKYYALALGERRRRSFDKGPGLSFQFGVRLTEDFPEVREMGLAEKRKLLRNTAGTRNISDDHGKGEFHVRDDGEIEIMCNADWEGTKGKRVSTWTQNRLLSLEGLNAEFALVKDCVTRAFR
jgi:hypothetical protein